MKPIVRHLGLWAVVSMLGGCAVGTPADSGVPDADAVELAALSQQAAEIAQSEAPDVALREVFTDLQGVSFLFTDREAVKVIYVHVPEPDAPTGQWTVQTDTVSQFVGRPDEGMDLGELRIGPRRAAQAIQEHWQGCTLSSMVLYEEGGTLVWRVFCETPVGLAAGNLDQETGIFQPDDGPPAPRPNTAVPSP